MTKEQGIFITYLAEQQLKDTTQRRKILELFLKTKRHVTAEEIHQELQKHKIRVGVSTIYRTMKLLCDCNLAREVNFGDGHTRFEQHHNKQHHDHMICMVCGRTIEFYNEMIEKIQSDIARIHDFSVYRHRLEIFGKCQRCKD